MKPLYHPQTTPSVIKTPPCQTLILVILCFFKSSTLFLSNIKKLNYDHRGDLHKTFWLQFPSNFEAESFFWTYIMSVHGKSNMEWEDILQIIDVPKVLNSWQLTIWWILPLLAHFFPPEGDNLWWIKLGVFTLQKHQKWFFYGKPCFFFFFEGPDLNCVKKFGSTFWKQQV